MALLEHLYQGGKIRFNQKTKAIQLVLDGLEVKGIPCTEGDVWNLIQDKHADFWTDVTHQGVVMVLGAADVERSISQRDREVFQALLDHWKETGGGLPGKISYQDVNELCDKFNVPCPDVVIVNE